MLIGDIAVFDVTTGHGSNLTVKFMLTGYYENETYGNQYPMGDLVVEGFAKSIMDTVSFAGLGFMPEVGSKVAVKEAGKDKDGMSKFKMEIIVKLEDITKGVNTDIEKSQQ